MIDISEERLSKKNRDLNKVIDEFLKEYARLSKIDTKKVLIPENPTVFFLEDIYLSDKLMTVSLSRLDVAKVYQAIVTKAKEE